MLVRYDSEADATFVQLEPEAAVARTVEILDGHLLVDVDGSGHPIGIEILCAPAEVDDLAFTALARRCPDFDVDAIRTVRAAGERLPPDSAEPLTDPPSGPRSVHI